jgi:hypothetical protein
LRREQRKSRKSNWKDLSENSEIVDSERKCHESQNRKGER